MDVARNLESLLPRYTADAVTGIGLPAYLQYFRPT